MVDMFRRALHLVRFGLVQGGRCLVTWQKVTRPVELGGLGVLDLTTLGYALRLRWEWQAKTSPDKPWTTHAAKPECAVQAMLTVDIGNGRHALFWHDRWIDGSSLLQLAPDLVAAVPKRSSRTVADALHNDRWIPFCDSSCSICRNLGKDAGHTACP
jgi:hypothetical protein